jgi:hypothetical protein
MEAREAAQYIKSLAPETFQHLFLLTDYEFINQSMTGVDIVLETKCRRSLVVTNHFAAKEIQGFALKASTSLLPKPLVHRIPITVETPHSPAAGVHEAQSQSPHKNQRQSIRTPSRPSLTHP